MKKKCFCLMGERLGLMLFIGVFLICGPVGTSHAINITPTSDPNVLVSALLEPGVNLVGITNFQLAQGSAGTFSGGLSLGPTGLPTGLGFDSGVILTTGRSADAVGPNQNARPQNIVNDIPGSSDDATTTTNAGPDSDLGVNTFDATFLEFVFDTAGAVVDLSVNYIFATEEYHDFVGQQFNDTFGFFLSGPSFPSPTNLALVPGTQNPVSVNTINAGTGTQFFNSNNFDFVNDPVGWQTGTAPFDLEYDGFTTLLTASASGLAAGTYTMKVSIADVADTAVDSAVFLQSAGFIVTPVDPIPPVDPPTGPPNGNPPPGTNPVPEPGTMFLMGSGLFGLLAWRWKQQRGNVFGRIRS